MVTISQYLNGLSPDALRIELQKCCAACSWVEGMAHRVPFGGDAEVEASATRIWWELKPSQWLEAFAAHPRIGDVASLRAKFANTSSWANQEQAGMAICDEATLLRLAELNNAYFQKFGFIFIICAAGKSAAEMVTALQQRMLNDLETERQIAAAEQLKITLLRLRKLST